MKMESDLERSPVPLKVLERQLINASKVLAATAVLGSLAGAILMFMLGLINIYEAYDIWFADAGVYRVESDVSVPRSSFSMIRVIEALDRFLIAIVLLYFGFGVYSLFIRPHVVREDTELPSLLHVDQIGQLKQVVAEVIIVILFVLFLRTALQALQNPNDELSWRQLGMLLVLPVSTVLLALALKLVELHPKPVRPISNRDDTSGSRSRSG